MNRRTALALAVTSALALTTGCGASSADEGGGSRPGPGAKGSSINLEPKQNRVQAKKVPEIAKLVPDRIRERGTLDVVNSAGSTPPLTFYATDDRTVIGVETDLASLVADVLGLKVRYHSVDWANIFVGLDSGKYDAGFSNITVTEERKEKYDFATYRLDTIAFEAKKGKDWKVKGPADVAGRTIGVSSGTNQEKLLVDWSERNVKAGRKATQIKYFQNSSDYYLALGSGRIDAYLGPNPVASYHAKTTGQTEVIGTFSGAGEGVEGKIAATTKKDNGLVKALHKAVQRVVDHGEYRKVLKRWGLTGEAVRTSELNPEGLPKTS
ncbi:ABC transporter substrate-binding protein [Streptomyces boluensis]|uniref:Transporter substrate-binding domain-containing protein n=1 Tax=Streptomyces boluensis TaxID=1775135 RepID=A0A964UYW4_9ACTN|nr:ABC transporter substrate-binding protein [Streptomyces boluensis]NBE56863.1 transporter substrate-binding domain-containing protein [Streptomyces boluensis]